MPGLDGRQLLERMKSDIVLREIPIVAMTRSTSEEDIGARYKAGANILHPQTVIMIGL